MTLLCHCYGEFWQELVGSPLVLTKKLKIHMGMVNTWSNWPDIKHSDLFLSSFQLDCHHQEGFSEKLGNC